MKNVICLSHSTPLPSLHSLSTKDCKTQMTNNCEQLMLLRIWQLTGASRKSNLNHRQYKPESKDTMSWHNSWCASPTAGSFSSYLFQQDDSLDSFYSNTINTLRISQRAELSSWLWKMCFETFKTAGTCTHFWGTRALKNERGTHPAHTFCTPHQHPEWHTILYYRPTYMQESVISIYLSSTCVFIIHKYVAGTFLSGINSHFWRWWESGHCIFCSMWSRGKVWTSESWVFCGKEQWVNCI